MDQLLQKINEWREQSLQLKQLEAEIARALPDGDSEYYSPQMFEGFHATKTSAEVLITHSEGWTGRFFRPGLKIQYGRPAKYRTDEERRAARLKQYAAANKKRRKKKAD